MNDNQAVLRFGPSSGSFLGVVGLLACVLVLAVVVSEGFSPASTRVALATAVFAVLTWAFMLRPRILVETGTATLVLRNPLTTWRIALATVRVVGVRTVTTVKTDDARYDAVAVGYPLRKVVRGSGPGAGAPRRSMLLPSMPGDTGDDRSARPDGQDEQSVMVEAVLAAAEKARFEQAPVPPPVRSYAVVELALVGVAAVAFLVTFLF